MATKPQRLPGSDCFGDDIYMDLTRSKDKVTVESQHGDKFCCSYSDLADIVAKLAPKKKKEPTP
jgi:hypothetical protein